MTMQHAGNPDSYGAFAIKDQIVAYREAPDEGSSSGR